jgi:hypothetical protein
MELQRQLGAVLKIQEKIRYARLGLGTYYRVDEPSKSIRLDRGTEMGWIHWCILGSLWGRHVQYSSSDTRLPGSFDKGTSR